MKNFFRKVSILLLFGYSYVEAKDFGVKGHCFPIQEENLVHFLIRSSQTLTKEKIQALFKKKIENPSAVASIRETNRYRSFTFDPSWTSQEDIKDARGRLILAKGTTVNPLEKIQLSKGLLFLDGSQEEHLKWAREQGAHFKWILVKGRPLDVEKTEKHPIFFDQRGFCTQKLGITHVPARVSQKDTLLFVEEVPLSSSIKGKENPSPRKEIKNDIPTQLHTEVDPEVLDFIHSLPPPEGDCMDPNQKCTRSTTLVRDLEKLADKSSSLRIFLSFSVPEETWKELSIYLEKIGGVFVLRGIPENSFRTFSSRILELREKGIQAPIQIDPHSFERYHIEAVPAFVLEKGSATDKLTGNVQLQAILQQFKKQGSCSQRAASLLKKWMSHSQGGS